MNEMARVSCDGYRAVVREDERFVSFFQSITPGGSSPAVLALLSVGGARECLLLARAHPPTHPPTPRLPVVPPPPSPLCYPCSERAGAHEHRIAPRQAPLPRVHRHPARHPLDLCLDTGACVVWGGLLGGRAGGRAGRGVAGWGVGEAAAATSRSWPGHRCVGGWMGG